MINSASGTPAKKIQNGFAGLELLLIVITLSVLAFCSYYVFSHHKNAQQSHSSNANGSATHSPGATYFPTHHLSFSLPGGWTTAAPTLSPNDTSSWPSGGVATHQTADWGWPEYVIDINSKEQTTEPVICGLPCESSPRPKVPLFTIEIADYGTNRLTSAGQWYQARLAEGTFPPPSGYHAQPIQYADFGSNSAYRTTVFAGQNAYCVRTVATGLAAQTTAPVLPGKPANIPNELFEIRSRGCYILWKNRIYLFNVTLNGEATASNDASLLTLLESLKFVG